MIRYGAAGRQWGPRGVGFGPMTPDGLALHFTEISGATVGERMYVANGDEWRLSSAVLAIERLDHPNA